MKALRKTHYCEMEECSICSPNEKKKDLSVEKLKKQVLELVTDKPEKAAVILEQWLRVKK